MAFKKLIKGQTDWHIPLNENFDDADKSFEESEVQVAELQSHIKELDVQTLELQNQFPVEIDSDGNELGTIVIHVDNTSTMDKEDGSESYPFKSLKNAIRFVSQKNYWAYIRIALHNKKYVEESSVSLRAVNMHLTISPVLAIGEAEIDMHSFGIASCSSVNFSNITFNSKAVVDFIGIYDSNVSFSNCNIVAYNRDVDTKVALWVHRSRLICYGVKIYNDPSSKKFGYGLYANNNSFGSFLSSSSMVCGGLGFYSVSSIIINEKATTSISAITTHGKARGGQIFE